METVGRDRSRFVAFLSALALLRIVHLALVGLVLVACGDRDLGVAESSRVDSAGIEVLTGPPHDTVLSLRIEKTWEIGGSRDERLALAAVGPWALATDSTHRLYVLDVVGRVVSVVDSAGRIVSSLGGLGDGPGELQDPVAIGGLSGGGISVIDLGKGRFVSWDVFGAILPESPLPAAIVMSPVRFAKDHSLLTIPGRDSLGQPERRLTVADTQLTILARTRLPTSHEATFPSCGLRVHVVPVFSPRLIWDARDDHVAVVSDERYRIEIFDHRKLIKVIRRDVPPVEATRQMAMAVLEGEGGRSGECVVPLEEEVAGRGIASLVPVIDGIVFRSPGELWASRSIPRKPIRIDVISTRIGYVGTLPEGIPMPTLFLSLNQFVTIGTDEFGGSTISSFKIKGRDGS